MQNDGVGRTLLVAGVLCVVCSIVVSSSAVLLRPQQTLNKKLDMKKNLLLSCGLLGKDEKATKEVIDQKFGSIKTILVDLDSGDLVEGMDVDNYDPKKAAKDSKSNKRIQASQDLGKIKTRAKVAKIYLVQEAGQTTMVVLPIHGKGLWSTLYGFLALSTDTKTVKGIGFYQHGETPGLGGEVDNLNWKAGWVGKTVVNENYEPMIRVIKGFVDPASAQAQSQVDGLSGATITSNGVQNLVNYWMGQDGYAKFLTKFREGGIL